MLPVPYIILAMFRSTMWLHAADVTGNFASPPTKLYTHKQRHAYGTKQDTNRKTKYRLFMFYAACFSACIISYRCFDFSTAYYAVYSTNHNKGLRPLFNMVTSDFFCSNHYINSTIWDFFVGEMSQQKENKTATINKCRYHHCLAH